MPTLSAKNHIEWHKKETSFFSQHQKAYLPEIPLTVLDEHEELTPETCQICDLIAQADIILGTGHLHLKEIRLLVDEAIKRNVKKILMQHPQIFVNASIDDMIYFADRGVFIEQSYGAVYSGRLTKEILVDIIRNVGAERMVIATDLGQQGRVYPIEGFKNCIKDLLEMGVTEKEIDFMLRKNPARLLGLE
jgi:predicted metal-dependent TIM-barrel fold hydrolase